MNSQAVIISVLSASLLVNICSGSPQTEQVADGDVQVSAYAMDTIPPGVKALMSCYPEQVVSYFDGKIVFAGEECLVFDDGLEKSFLQSLDDADVEDMFSILYNRKSEKPSYLQDPGRIRCAKFFKMVYGNSESVVRSNLISVDWFEGQKLKFNRINGAADSLKAVYLELRQLPKEYHRYCTQATTFYWRNVRGANRLSAHSFGIAIDINTSYADYWLWANPKAKELDKIEYQNRIPLEIVEAFERHGFISGTRWYHFDTMHFEFRPELFYTMAQE